MTISITHDQLNEIVNTHVPVKSGAWRWGTTESYVFKKDGKHFLVTARFHVQEGLQNDGDVAAYEVKPVEKTVVDWVRV